jgi:hypothetical protein
MYLYLCLSFEHMPIGSDQIKKNNQMIPIALERKLPKSGETYHKGLWEGGYAFFWAEKG